MMSDRALADLAREIEKQGYPPDKAFHFAALIGDTPIRGKDGKLLVMDEHGIILARLKWVPAFGN